MFSHNNRLLALKTRGVNIGTKSTHPLVSPQDAKGFVAFDLEGTLVDPSTRQSYPGLSQLLTTLGEADISLFVWTRAGHSGASELLKQLDLMGFFWDISSADDTYSKPDPRGLRELIGPQWEKLPGVVVGDSLGDLEGAKNMKCFFLLAAWQNSGAERMELPDRFYGHSKTLGMSSTVEDAEEILLRFFA